MCSRFTGIVHVADRLCLLSGVCISLKDPALAVAIECCLRSFMKAFCCDNYKDEAVLQELMSRYYPKGSRPQIIVSPFSDKVYNIHGRWAAAAFSTFVVFVSHNARVKSFLLFFFLSCRKAYHPEYPSVLDMITAANPVIINCLIDMRGIESILIIKVGAVVECWSRFRDWCRTFLFSSPSDLRLFIEKEKDKARKVMQHGRPPKNCREAFTVEGDQVFPNRYYTSEFSMAKYLGGDIETELRWLHPSPIIRNYSF